MARRRAMKAIKEFGGVSTGAVHGAASGRKQISEYLICEEALRGATGTPSDTLEAATDWANVDALMHRAWKIPCVRDWPLW